MGLSGVCEVFEAESEGVRPEGSACRDVQKGVRRAVQGKVGDGWEAHGPDGLALQIERPRPSRLCDVRIRHPARGKLNRSARALLLDVRPHPRATQGELQPARPRAAGLRAQAARAPTTGDVSVQHHIGPGVVVGEQLVGELCPKGMGVHFAHPPPSAERPIQTPVRVPALFWSQRPVDPHLAAAVERGVLFGEQVDAPVAAAGVDSGVEVGPKGPFDVEARGEDGRCGQLAAGDEIERLFCPEAEEPGELVGLA